MRSLTAAAVVGAIAVAARCAAASAAVVTGDWHALNHLAAQQAKAHDDAGLRDTLAALAPALPGSPTIAWQRAQVAVRLGRADDALATLSALADAGLVFDPAADPAFASIADRADFHALAARFAANRGAIGASRVLRRLPVADTLPEALAWDARARRLFIGDVRRCEIRVLDDPRRPHAAPTSGRRFARLPASVFALGIDASRHRLWATIASVAQADGCGDAPPATERTALVALDLHDGRVVQRIEAGVPGVLGDMLVADDGTVFASEGVHGAVLRLRLRPGATAFERLDVAGDFLSPQTPALSADGRTLFVPDYVRGLATLALDACPCAAHWPANGPGVFSAGIDGLVRDGDALVAVQNGVEPPRVIRFASDLSHQRVLESRTPGLGEPTHVIVVGDALWFIADVGWGRFDDDGHVRPGAPLPHPELRAIDLAADRATR